MVVARADRQSLWAVAVLGGMLAVSVTAWIAATAPEPQPMRQYDEALRGSAHAELTHEIVDRAQQLVAGLLSSEGCAPPDTAAVPADLQNKTTHCRELLIEGDLDVVISGGGFRGQYAGGVLSVLLLLEQAGRVRIRRWAGSSIGACTAAHFATGSSFRDFFRVPFAWGAVWTPRAFWRGGPVVERMMNNSVGPDALALVADGKLRVTLSTVSWPRPWRSFFFFEMVQVSHFRSRQDLISSLTASAAIPGLTANVFTNWWRGYYAVDAGFTSNTPIFTDNVRDQLVINLGFLDYAHLYTFTPLDPEHHKLVRQGQDDIAAFLRSRRFTNVTRQANQNLRPSLMLLSQTPELLLPESPVLEPAAQLLMKGLKIYNEARRRVEMDAVPWIRVVCVEGGLALRIYRLFGIAGLCDMHTIQVLEILLATVVLCIVLSAPLQCLLLGRAIERRSRRRGKLAKGG